VQKTTNPAIIVVDPGTIAPHFSDIQKTVFSKAGIIPMTTYSLVGMDFSIVSCSMDA
jgi:hypothetical protein